NNLKSQLIDYISNKQVTILENDHLQDIFTEETVIELETVFLEKHDLEYKEIKFLVEYTENLTILSNKIAERKNINQDLVKSLCDSEVMQEELKKMPILDIDLNKKVDDKFTLLEDENDTKSELTKLEETYDDLVNETIQ